MPVRARAWLLAALLAPPAARAYALAPAPRLAEALQLLQTYAEPSSAKLAAAGEEPLKGASRSEWPEWSSNPARRRDEERRERDRQKLLKDAEDRKKHDEEVRQKNLEIQERKRLEWEKKQRAKEDKERRLREAAEAAAKREADAAKEREKEKEARRQAAVEKKYNDSVAAAAIVPKVQQHPIDEKALNASLGSARNRLLLFWAVGSDSRAMQLVKENIAQARKFEAHGELATSDPLRIDVYLAHYDLNKSWWKTAIGADWYEKNVRYSANRKGIKFWLARDLLTFHRHTTATHKITIPPNITYKEIQALHEVDLSAYEYLWFLDEDANFTGMNVSELVYLARQTEASIVTPAIVLRNTASGSAGALDKTQAPEGASRSPGDKRVLHRHATGCQTGDTLCYLQAPRDDCKYRYTDFAEVSFPLLKPRAFRQVVEKCKACLPVRQSSWGLDRVWCKTASEGQSKRERSCAILDAVHIIHQNYQTLPKWKESSTGDRQSDWDTYYEVRRVKGHQWVENPKALECIEP